VLISSLHCSKVAASLRSLSIANSGRRFPSSASHAANAIAM